MLSAEPKIAEGVKMTELEKRLARRIHNQRRRLAQMEEFNRWQTGQKDRELKNMYRKIASDRLEKIRELEAKLASRQFETV